MSTLAEVATTLVALGASYGALRREIRAIDLKVDGVRTELKADIAKLDDRAYTLATGLRPVIEQSQRVD